MTAGHRFRANALWSAAGTLLPIIIGAGSVPVLLDALGRAGFAIYAICLGLVSFAPSLDLGVSRTAFRRMTVVTSSGEDPTGLVADALTRIRKVAAGAVVLLLGVVWGAYSARWLLAEESSRAVLAVLVAVLGLAPAMVANVQRALLEGAGLFGASAMARIVLALVSSVVPVVVALVLPDVLILSLLMVFFRAAMVVQQSLLLRKHHLLPRSGAARERTLMPDFWQESRWYAISAPVSLLMSGYDRLVVAMMTGLTMVELSAFVAPQEIALKALIIPAAIIPAVMVRVAGRLHGDEKTKEFLRNLMMGVCGLVLSYCVVAAASAERICATIFPSLQSDVTVEITKILIMGIFSNAVAQFPMAALTTAGHVRATAILQCIELPVFMGMVWWLTRHDGVVGAAWAWSVRTMMDTTGLIGLMRRHMPSQPWAACLGIHLAGMTILIVLMLL